MINPRDPYKDIIVIKLADVKETVLKEAEENNYWIFKQWKPQKAIS